MPRISTLCSPYRVAALLSSVHSGLPLRALLAIEEPGHRAPFRQFSFCVVRGHFGIVPTTGSLHIDECGSGLCEGDRGADTQRVAGDETFDSGCIRPLLDNPTGTHDREAFRCDMLTAAYSSE